jgi:hypothetical protein
VKRVVKVVAPLSRETEPSDFDGTDEARVVQVALGDERERPPLASRDRSHLLAQLLEEMNSALIIESMNGVQTESVESIGF